LMDDNFSSIVLGIEQGRIIFDNLKKTIAYSLTHLPPELIAILVHLFLAFPAALTSLQILSIDLLTELGPAISLSYEAMESDIMKRTPRNVKKDRLVTRPLLIYSYLMMGLFESGAGLFAFFWTFWDYGYSPSNLFYSGDHHWNPAVVDNQYFDCSWSNITTANGTTSTAGPYGPLCISPSDQITKAGYAASGYYIAVILSQCCHVFMCKTTRISYFKHKGFNHVTIYGIGWAVILMIIFVYVPGLQTVMGSNNASYYGYATAAGSGACIWIFNEWRKWYIRTHPGTRMAYELTW
jgi:sodium/potassium-transporting ATPase subunit alpha